MSSHRQNPHVARGSRTLEQSGGRGLLRCAGLLISSATLVLLSFEPFAQAYLAWVALVPLLIVIAELRSGWTAFPAAWVVGAAFSAASIWWLWSATIPGTIALVAYFGLYWGLFAAIVRGTRLLSPEPTGAWSGVIRVILLATVWVGVEWLRPFVIPSFPGVMLGWSQTPLLVMCQIADVAGVFGISFWVMMVNGVIVLFFLHRRRWRVLLPSAGITVLVALAVLGYGLFRYSQAPLSPGPQVMVVQPNHPHLRGGASSVSREVAVAYQLEATREGLRSASPDLILWPESAMPPLNPEARSELQASPAGTFLETTHQAISRLAAEAGAAIVTGGFYVGGWQSAGGMRTATDRRGSAYFYDREGRQSTQRYDKIQLVPFSETMPLRWAPWLHRMLLLLAAPAATEPLTPGEVEALTVFTLEPRPGEATTSRPASGTYRFVTPICLENIDSALVARMFRGPEGKRADFLLNLSNDGWFGGFVRDQHLQSVLLRCVENRVPAALCSNTGISAFIDSSGRVIKALPARSEGVATCQLMLDARVAPYTRWGDAFPAGCALVSLLLVAGAAVRRLRRRARKAEG